MIKMTKGNTWVVLTIIFVIMHLLTIALYSQQNKNLATELNDLKVQFEKLAIKKYITIYRDIELNNVIKKLDDRSVIIEFLDTYTKNTEITEIILYVSLEYEVPFCLLFAFAKAESNYDRNATNTNSNGSVDYGLFQLNNRYREEWTIEELFDLTVNTTEAARILKKSIEQYDDKRIYIITAYNMGSAGMRRWGTPYHRLDYVNNIINTELELEIKINEILNN